MVISVVSAIGSGNTTLSAFDNALKKAGVYNYNLIALSSIIPVGAKVVKVNKVPKKSKEFGWRLYVVLAEIRTNQSDKVIGAGLGWYLFDDGSGVFVEHEVEGLTEDGVTTELKLKLTSSIADLCAFRGVSYHEHKLKISIAICPAMSAPHCALTVAIYKAEPWE